MSQPKLMSLLSLLLLDLGLLSGLTQARGLMVIGDLTRNRLVLRESDCPGRFPAFPENPCPCVTVF